jgi:hypothetical protein
VYHIDVLKWITYRVLCRPISWFWALTCLALWPAATIISPVGIALRGEGPSRLILDVAFLSVLGGVALALSALGDNRWVLCRAGSVRKSAAQATALLAGGALGGVFSLAAPLLLVKDLPLDWSLIILATLITVTHAAALGILLLRLPLGGASLAFLLMVSAWIVPCLLRGGDQAGSALATILRTDRTLDSLRDPTLAELTASFSPIIALWLGAALLCPSHRPDLSTDI